MILRMITLSLVWMFAFINLTAQVQADYIEITATDTILLRPITIEYKIGFNQYAYQANYDEYGNVVENTLDIRADLRSLKTELSRSGFMYEHITSADTYSLPKYDQGVGSLKFKFRDQKELVRMLETVDEFKNIEGSVETIHYEPVNDVLKQKLYTKVYNGALGTASMMASVANRKVGKLISVVNLNGAAAGMDASQGLFSNMFSLFSGGSSQDAQFNGSTQMTCTFRFELVD
jgi:hypothetical protein